VTWPKRVVVPPHPPLALLCRAVGDGRSLALACSRLPRAGGGGERGQIANLKKSPPSSALLSLPYTHNQTTTTTTMVSTPRARHELPANLKRTRRLAKRRKRGERAKSFCPRPPLSSFVVVPPPYSPFPPKPALGPCARRRAGPGPGGLGGFVGLEEKEGGARAERTTGGRRLGGQPLDSSRRRHAGRQHPPKISAACAGRWVGLRQAAAPVM